MERRQHIRLHPIVAAAATAVIIACLLEIASLSGVLNDWMGRVGGTTVAAAKNSVRIANSASPNVPAAPPSPSNATAVEKSYQQREAIAAALAIDTPGKTSTRLPSNLPAQLDVSVGSSGSGTTASGGGR